MSQDYEKLYTDLKTEYEQMKTDNEEICKEYELTIQMLTDSVTNYQKEKDNFQSRISQLETEIKKYEKEKENLSNRNKDKIIDIQNLNKANEKLKKEIKEVLDEKHLTKTKIISLENANDHYQGKLRENEALIEDLTNQLESALEENITLQTEFEMYKQQNEEALIRKEQEIKDFKNDLINKEKIIQRLNDKRASIRDLKMKLQLPNEIMKQYRRQFTTLEGINENAKNKSNNVSSIENIKKENSVIINNDKIITPLSNTTTKYPSKFMDIYRKSIGGGGLLINQVGDKKNNIRKSIDLMEGINFDDELLVTKNSNSNILKVNTLKDDSIIEGENEDKNEKDEIEDDSTDSEKKCFEDLVICEEKDFNIIPIKKLMSQSKKARNKKLADNLKSMLARIQKRKEALINHQKSNNKKFEKLGIKLRY
jgi:hypothetical protein